MFVIAMPPAIKVRPIGIAMHVSPVAGARYMHLAVFVIPVPAAIQVPTVRIAMHVAVVMAMPVVSVDVDILRSMRDRIGGRCDGLQARGQPRCCRDRQ